jgi:4-hydroxy-tetrahydrodipicolinate synthase
MIDAGLHRRRGLGSLGESATLSVQEKLAVLQTLVRSLEGRAPVVAGIAALSTDEAAWLAREAASPAAAPDGAAALRLLDRLARDARARLGRHRRDVDPVHALQQPDAYRTDFRPEHVAELARTHDNLVAVKESSADVRRIGAIRHLLGDRLRILVGVDDLIVEGIEPARPAGSPVLVNALPTRSVALFRLALEARSKPALRAETTPCTAGSCRSSSSTPCRSSSS